MSDDNSDYAMDGWRLLPENGKRNNDEERECNWIDCGEWEKAVVDSGGGWKMWESMGRGFIIKHFAHFQGQRRRSRMRERVDRVEVVDRPWKPAVVLVVPNYFSLSVPSLYPTGVD